MCTLQITCLSDILATFLYGLLTCVRNPFYRQSTKFYTHIGVATCVVTICSLTSKVIRLHIVLYDLDAFLVAKYS